MDSIYLDHNATTPIHPEVVAAMTECYAQGHANPASQHLPGQRARRVLDDARSRIAEILGADLAGPGADRLIFTGSGTEANSLAVLGIARAGGIASLAAGGTASLAADGTASLAAGGTASLADGG
ncbi:MAG: aminotransferase class V-fold PLP-dependent enzyme, partial [Candidatus Nealsonbacteria bacterium]|nr:aminotransferase class V-fold PLP-dependent enzyme [Candidatus Nealsonbacteria bacterium]